MKSIINSSRLLAAVLCVAVIAGCDTIQDVRSEPSTAEPGSTGVLEGTVIGLAPQREVVLNAGMSVEGYNNSRAVFGALGNKSQLINVPFAYPAVPVGTPYNLTVEKQPFGKICTIENGSGTIGGGTALPLVTCTDDPNIVRYTIGGTVAPEIANLPGFAVTLTSNRDYGDERIELNGATSFEFTNRGINPTLSPVYAVAVQQLFQWTITATYVQDGKVYQCRVVTSQTNNTPSNTGYSSAQAGFPAAPFGSVALPGTNSAAIPGPVTTGITRHVRDCFFPIEANVKYSAPPGGADEPMGNGGVTLALRQTGNAVPPDVPPVTLTEFTPGSSRVVLWNLPSYVGAAYDLVVTEQPEGQTCIVRVLNNQASLGSIIWLSNPITPAHFTPSDANIANGVSIRCRNNPEPQNQLSGVFQNINENTYSTAPEIRIRDRQVLSFFDDGTFLMATHGNSTARNGVEYGFYNYDAALGTLDFNLFLDSSTLGGTYEALAGGVIGLEQPASLSNTLGYGTIPAMTPARLNNNAASAPNGGVARATGVTVNAGNPASISMTFSGVPVNSTGVAQGGGVVRSQTWTFTEPRQNQGQMTGAWTSGDNRRVWVYDYVNTTGMHAGVNGPINLQDACFVFDDPEATSSFYTRRGGSTGCMTTNGGTLFVPAGSGRYFEYYEGGFATIDCVPSDTTGLFTGGSCGSGAPAAAPPGFLGRFPGAQAAFDSRPPSPNTYTVIPGNPETLSVQRTLNGDPLGAPVEFERAQVKLH